MGFSESILGVGGWVNAPTTTLGTTEMRKAAKLLLYKAVNSLTLSVEMFNRPWNKGRVEGVLIFLDHSFEMLLKAGIAHRGGKIREARAKNTIGFDACVRKGLSDGNIKFLSEEQALTLQAVNSLRDAAQHHLLDISEQHLYMQAQAGLTLFRDLYASVFGLNLKDAVPERVLPVCSSPPCDLISLFDNEIAAIREMLKPNMRKQIEALSKLRSLAIVNQALLGETVQPGQSDLKRLAGQIAKGMKWEDVFPGVAAVNLTTKGIGPTLELRITKKEGTPIHLVPEGTPNASVVAVKRVDELGFYNLGRDQVAQNVGLSKPRTTAVIRFLKIQDDPECFKKVTIGKAVFSRYSQKAIQRIKEALPTLSLDDVWNKCGPKTPKG